MRLSEGQRRTVFRAAPLIGKAPSVAESHDADDQLTIALEIVAIELRAFSGELEALNGSLRGVGSIDAGLDQAATDHVT